MMMNKCVICMLWLLLLVVNYATEAESSVCTRRCGGVDIPFPFGIEAGCFVAGFDVVCNMNDSKLYYRSIQIVGIDLNTSQATILQPITTNCPDFFANATGRGYTTSGMNLTGSPFFFSNARNIFTAIGCDAVAYMISTQSNNGTFSDHFSAACVSLCNNASTTATGTFDNNICSGTNGCCQTAIPPRVQQFTSFVSNYSGASSFNSCSYTFLVDRLWFSLNGSTGQDFYERNEGLAPVVVDWTCGDPACQNIQQPRRRSSKNILMIISASAGGSLLLLLAIITLRRKLKQRNLVKKKKKNYRKNLQLLRNTQPSSSDDIVIERMKIYELDELEKATNYFDKTRIIGGGGHGNVYKGILSDQCVVAIKRPKITNESELGQFINEVFILSDQTSHINVVKFFGCCLETEVPLLVFEFISGGTLSDHLIDRERHSPLSFEDRLRIAYEIARALSYVHSEASITIFHRDVKSCNILLDERNISKLADFGASRIVVTSEKNSVTTIVQGTLGYLDPEYYQTGRLTEKSDVYSFGVILAELLTGKKAINEMRPLVMDFLSSLKEKSLHEILDPIVLNEAKEEIVESMTKLVERCLKLNGNERPTMKEVEDSLEAMRAKKSDVDIDASTGVGGLDSFAVVRE